ncbi:MAG: NAD-dependent epimerase/dehydratase family protein [Anaerolineae bacterium]|nr:NAD-dependent epimerase/dehydratase family protein [Anaerolineae bacterium]
MSVPNVFETVEALEAFLSIPTPEVIDALGGLDGDVMILGAGGKMGPTLALLARRAVDAGRLDKRVIAVSRFSDDAVTDKLRRAGIETISCDLMDNAALNALPDARNIVYMVGMKFGATGQEARTWAINAYLPGRVVQRFSHSRFVLFSSGNVYPLTSVFGGGCAESTPPAPIGEYAQSVLGRERVFQHWAEQLGTPGVIFRLNYAVELRYGVLLDVAQKVWAGAPADLRMGYVNAIWQGDANAYALRALSLASSPPQPAATTRLLNVTGPETISVRRLAERFGGLLGREPVFEGEEQPDALLNDASQAFKWMGYPRVPLAQAVEWVADWVQRGGPTLDKPTKFQVRDGKF